MTKATTLSAVLALSLMAACSGSPAATSKRAPRSSDGVKSVGAGNNGSLSNEGGGPIEAGGQEPLVEATNQSLNQTPETEVCQLPAVAAPGVLSVAPRKNSAGAVMLSGAGRVRIRHEKEKLYGLFPNFYWENRTFGFELEDRSSLGETVVKLTYQPAAPQATDPRPNIRAFYTGSGNIFQLNDMMEQQGEVYTYTITDSRIKKGSILEFEFGIFLDQAFIRGRDKAGVRAGDTNYYTDTFRYLVGEGKLVGEGQDPALYAGGDTTLGPVVEEPETSFSQVALNIQKETIEKFVKGRALFHTNFMTGAHSEADKTFLPEMIDKHKSQIGPLFNAHSCSECHVKNGRSGPPSDASQPLSTMVLRTALKEAGGADSSKIHPQVGQQLNHLATSGAQAEGQAFVSYETVKVDFADGSSAELRRPVYEVRLNGGDGSDLVYSPRVARQIVGMGLLEAVDLTSVVALAQAQCQAGKTVSGRANRVVNPLTGEKEWGRFGWKGAKTSVAHQVAQALHLDLDVSSEVFPSSQCTAPGCNASAGSVEVDKEALGELTTYVQTLGVPARRNTGDPVVKQGEAAFLKVGCNECHMPTLQTSGEHPLAELRNQIIHPYTDLLLHDMGPDLADRVSEGEAQGSEWRTAPLWGLGLLKAVNGSMTLLHDGRARSVTEAVLWHGGEASQAKTNFINLTKEEREAIERFVESL